MIEFEIALLKLTLPLFLVDQFNQLLKRRKWNCTRLLIFTSSLYLLLLWRLLSLHRLQPSPPTFFVAAAVAMTTAAAATTTAASAAFRFSCNNSPKAQSTHIHTHKTLLLLLFLLWFAYNFAVVCLHHSMCDLAIFAKWIQVMHIANVEMVVVLQLWIEYNE